MILWFIEKNVGVNMKKIILIDDGSLADFVFKYTDWEVELFVCTQSGKKDTYRNNIRIKDFVELEDMVENSEMHEFSIEDVDGYSSAFATLDYGLHRYRKGMQCIHYEYYASVAFWEHIFKKKKIDFCLIETIDHGTQKDCMLKMAAKKYDIPVFQLTVSHFNVKSILYTDKNGEKILPIIHDKDTLPECFFSDMAYYALKQNNKGLKRRLRSKCGTAAIRSIKMMLSAKTVVAFPGSMYRFNVYEYFYSYFYMKRMQKYISKNYVKFDGELKYIIFFLHFEPEAMISHYANIMDSQLIIIQMLSENLPQGWTLYVKEHPDMYKMKNEPEFEYYMPSQSIFFSRYFVDKILSLNNVKILDVKIPSKGIIENAQAIATVCSTVVLDAIKQKKPCIIFANKTRTYLSKCKDVMCVSSVKELREVYKKLVEEFKPDYSDYKKILNRYNFVITEKKEYDGYKVAINTIRRYIEEV